MATSTSVRDCPHCGAACECAAGARECPCCGQPYAAQGMVDHLPLPDDDARLAPVPLLVAAAVALLVVAVVLVL
jgi:hypothetical protein